MADGKNKTFIEMIRSMRLIWIGFMVSGLYWVLESFRDVYIFHRGTIIERMFVLDPMSFWMRMLVVCIIILFSTRAHSVGAKVEKESRLKLVMENKFEIIGIGIGFSSLYWIIESFRDSFIFGKNDIFQELFMPDAMSLWIRMLAICFILLFAAYAQSMINIYKRTERKLREKQTLLEQIVAQKTEEFRLTNEKLQQEIREREKAEQNLKKINRTLKALSEGNKTLVRAVDEKGLIDNVCNILVKFGEYQFVWVSFIDHNKEDAVQLVAKAGDDRGFLKSCNITTLSGNRYSNPVGYTIQKGKRTIIKLSQPDCEDSKFCREAIKCNFKSFISLPLLDKGDSFGSVNIFSEDQEMFDENELGMLSEMTYDLSFGIAVLRDREEQRLMKRKLEKSEEKYRTLTENVNAGIYRNTPGPDGKFIEANTAFLKIFGFKNKKELFKTKVSDLYQDTREREKLSQKLMKRGFIKGEELRLKRVDGTKIWASVNAVAVRDRRGKVRYFDGVVEDITERKIMEDEIEKRRKYLESVLHNIPDAIITLDASNRVIEWNKGAENVFGYSKKEALGQNIDQLITGPDVYEEAKTLSRKVMTGIKLPVLETVRYSKDGSAVNVLVAGSPIWIGGELHGAVAVYTDITKRKNTEKELYRLNRALKMLSESNMTLVRANDEVSLLDSISNIIIDVGGFQLAWVGYIQKDDKEYLSIMSKSGKNVKHLNDKKIYFKDLSKCFAPIEEAINSSRPVVRAYCDDELDKKKNFREIKECVYRSAISLPLRSNGTVFGVLNIYSSNEDGLKEEEVKLLREMASDISFGITVLRSRIEKEKAEREKEKIHKQLLQAQKMEAIGILAGGVAHDFNNLLTAIIGSADMALMELSPESSAYNDLNEILVSAKRAADLTRQLLLFSRKQSMKLESVNISIVVKDLLKMLKRLIGEDIRIHTNIEKGLWNIWADRGTIEQVIMNLAVNARDAMPSGGELNIEARNKIINENQTRASSESYPGKFVCIAVKDTGVGMEKEIQQHIFEPFFSTKGVGKGTGLGLSVVYGIVKQHKGWIEVESKPDKGSTFAIYLPACFKKKEDDEEDRIFSRDIEGHGKRILVIEDEERVREFTVSGLDRSGYKVFAASNAREAEEIFKREGGNFNLVMSDVVLPDRSGVDLVKEFLTQKPNLNILFSSGYTDYHIRWPIIQKRGFRFLEKPYALGDLLRVIGELAA